MSLINVILKMNILGLSPEAETAYVIPYSGKAQFQLGYKGYQELAMRTGLYKEIEGSSKCLACPQNTYSAKEGATAPSECRACAVERTTNGLVGRPKPSTPNTQVTEAQHKP